MVALACDGDVIVTSDPDDIVALSTAHNQNFIEMGMPKGATLVFTQSDACCNVLSGRRVGFEGEELSLTALTRRLLGLEYTVQPSPYWTYAGRTLKEIYEETYDTP